LEGGVAVGRARGRTTVLISILEGPVQTSGGARKRQSKWKDPEVNLILVHTPGNHES
jgi:hypothetical protein